jgi:hypothetical protein
MKPVIVTLLVMSLIWGGCHSYYTIKEKENNDTEFIEERDLKIILKDGTEIASPAYLHTIVSQPSDFVLGSGREMGFWYSDQGLKPYSGKILMKDVDSLVTEVLEGDTLVKCYLRSGKVVVFEKDNYVRITPQAESGLWIKGSVVKGKYLKDCQEWLNPDLIDKLEANKFDIVTTGALIAVIFGVISYAAYQSNPWWH